MSPKRVVITGGSGLIGSALADALRRRGDDVVALTRGGGTKSWNPETGDLDLSLIEGADAVVNLSGASIGPNSILNAPAMRWTSARKKQILNSRVQSTSVLATAIAATDAKPGVFISGSAIGFYGDTGDTAVDESASGGDGFLASVVEDWEAAALPASEAGVRTVLARTGIVLARDGGALAPLLPLYKAGLGGPIGSGEQWWSWITLRDEVRAIEFLIDGDLEGPVNLTAPGPVTQRAFATELGSALKRPTVVPAPAFALDLVLGKGLAEAIGYGSVRVLPTRLEEAGFAFTSPSVDIALAEVFG
ncbi:MAG: TIGR01777 family oxidoreductase [Acidimicrobiia bacterium]